jgi:homoserine kinase
VTSMRVRVPASTANLGPGFDALGLALGLYLELSIELADALEVVTTGQGAGQFDDERHLGVRVAREVLGHTRFKLTVHSEIPLARGLGSSASLALAAAAAAGAKDPLAVATLHDGHAENAAASHRGGLVVATVISGVPIVETLTLDEELRFVLVVPEQHLTTADAREVLPSAVAFNDATFNLARLGLLIAGLADHRHLRPEAMQDRLHQRYRAPLLPFAEALLDTLLEAGALGSCWSGAGSAMLGVATSETATLIARETELKLHSLSVSGEVVVLAADRGGLTFL